MDGERYLLVGAGGFGREVICWLHDALSVDLGGGRLAFLDDRADALAGYDYGIPWAGSIADFAPGPRDRLVFGVTEPATKQRIAQTLDARGAQFLTLVHPSSVIARSARLGRGCVVCPLAMVSADARVGDFVTINTLCSVGHDVTIGDFTTMSSHVDITGEVTVGERAFFGSGARTVPRIKIGRDARIGAGSTVMRSVAEGVTVFTMPAKKLA